MNSATSSGPRLSGNLAAELHRGLLAEDLAPKMVVAVASLLEEIVRRGVSILLVEQKLTIALAISQRLYVMGHGRIVFEGTPDDLTAHRDVRREWLEV